MDPRIIPNQSAASSFTSDAKKISKGKSKTRIRFTNTDNSALDVRAKTNKSRVFTYFAVKSGKYVAVNIDNQKVLLNVNSAAKRLHIAKSEIINESKNADFIENLSGKVLVTEQVLDNYNNLLKDHFLASKKREKPLVRTGGEKTALNKELLMKVITVSLGKEIGENIALESSLLISTHQEEGKVNFQWIGNQVGSGGSAKIYNIEGDKDVYKWPDRSLAIPLGDILEEVRIVNKLNENGPQDGISLPMHLVKCISPQNMSSSSDIGLLMPRYANDYTALCPPEEIPLTHLSQEEIVKTVNEFEKLLSGLSYMHNQGILHGDIKPANILQKEDRTDLIDFGGARDINNVEKIFPKIGTALYMHADDTAALHEANEAKDIQMMISIEKARDVFALGTTFHERFECSYPFTEWNSKNMQSGIERHPLPEFVPQELAQLIEGMTHHDLSQRLTAQQALLQLQAYKLTL